MINQQKGCGCLAILGFVALCFVGATIAGGVVALIVNTIKMIAHHIH